jgi:hypothetical protein
MISSEIDRCRQHDCPAAGRFRETGEKIVPGHHRGAVSDCPEEFLEIFSAQRPPMFLVAKHHRVVEIKNDAAIGALQQPQLEFVKTDRLEKKNHVM